MTRQLPQGAVEVPCPDCQGFGVITPPPGSEEDLLGICDWCDGRGFVVEPANPDLPFR